MYYLTLPQINYSIDVNNKQIGFLGENVASAYLQSKGFQLLDKNWTCRWGELDIVALKGQQITFFEVKTRSSGDYGSPFEAISFYKRRALVRTVHNYLSLNSMRGKQWAIDLIGIELSDSNKYKLYHWEDLLS